MPWAYVRRLGILLNDKLSEFESLSHGIAESKRAKRESLDQVLIPAITKVSKRRCHMHISPFCTAAAWRATSSYCSATLTTSTL